MLFIINTEGYILSKTSIYKGSSSVSGRIKKAPLKLRSSNSNLVVCNEKFIYMKYLIGLRNFKKVYRIFKDTHEADIQNIINILNVLNYLNNTQITNATTSDSKSIYINNSHFQNNSLIINNTGSDSSGNNEKIAKHLILSNIYIDVSTVKYIQISTRNDTLVVELDKNNADMSSVSPNNIYNLMYDIGKIETLVSSISLLLKVMNIN
uniref:Uncharacterized protein n=1 Tax=viral metagenome TaxID=1070528 RepID=A0A6C0K9A0_9ZZZZ